MNDPGIYPAYSVKMVVLPAGAALVVAISGGDADTVAQVLSSLRYLPDGVPVAGQPPFLVDVSAGRRSPSNTPPTIVDVFWVCALACARATALDRFASVWV